MKSKWAMHLAPWALGCLFTTVAIHIIIVLSIPYVAQKSAYAKISKKLQGFTLLGEDDGHFSPPFVNPAEKLAVCAYDLTQNPVLISAIAEPDHHLSLGFYDWRGRVFYSVNNSSAIHGKIEIVIGQAKQIQAFEASDEDDAPPNELRLLSPSQKGFVLARTLMENRADEARARATLLNLGCWLRPI